MKKPKWLLWCALLCWALVVVVAGCVSIFKDYKNGTEDVWMFGMNPTSVSSGATPQSNTPTTQPGFGMGTTTIVFPLPQKVDQALQQLWALPLIGVGLMVVGVVALALKAQWLVIPWELGGYLIALGLAVTMLPTLLDRYSWALAAGIAIAGIHVWWRWNKNRQILQSRQDASSGLSVALPSGKD